MKKTKKGYRLIAIIYDNEKAYASGIQNYWGLRFFDETGTKKNKVIDISVKDLVNPQKKDMFNALSVHCYHAHLMKVNGTLEISCEDGNFEDLPCVTKAGVALKPAIPLVFEVIKKEDKVTAYNLVSPTGAISKMAVDDLKDFILTKLNGLSYIQNNGSIKGYNLKVFPRSNHFVLARANDYEYPEVTE